MSENRYYWIKLKTNFFEQEAIDFLMSQKNGCQYIVLYQMLCLKTANNNGELSTEIGEMIVPYDVNKIVRDTKYFDFDTVTVALELFAKLGLVYYSKNNSLQIANFNEMVGSASANANALRQKRFRERQKAKVIESVTDTVTNSNGEYRYKSIDNRDIDNRDIDNKNKENKSKSFVRPSVNDVESYCKENNLTVNAQQFIDYYDSNGWKVGKNSMKDWKATCRNWSRRENADKGKLATKPSFDIDEIIQDSIYNENY